MAEAAIDLQRQLAGQPVSAISVAGLPAARSRWIAFQRFSCRWLSGSFGGGSNATTSNTVSAISKPTAITRTAGRRSARPARRPHAGGRARIGAPASPSLRSFARACADS